jgi:hypothetical protein
MGRAACLPHARDRMLRCDNVLAAPVWAGWSGPSVTGHAAIKLFAMEKVHRLGENETAFVHG